MDEKNKDPQQLSPEEQLDLLLEKFREDSHDGSETPMQAAPALASEEQDPAAENTDNLLITPDAVPEDGMPVDAEAVDTENPCEDIEEEPTVDTAEEETSPLPEEIPGEDASMETETEEEILEEAVPEENTFEGSPADPLPEEPQGSDTVCPAEPSTAQPDSIATEDSASEQTPETTQQDPTPEEPAADTAVIPQEQDAHTTEESVPAVIPENNQVSAEAPFSELQEEEEEPDPERPVPPKKRRPKNNKTYGFFGIPHMLATVIWLGIVVFIGVGLGKFVWNCAADVLALGRTDTQVIITITEDDDLDSVAQKLYTTGLIQYPSLFKIYGNISDAMDSIRTGTFKLNTLFDYHALVDAMSSNQRRETTNVTIPEGYTCAQLFELLEKKGVSTVAKLEDAAANGKLGDYWFLEGVERGTANCLEGFLFPDTYTFYLDHDPVGVLQKFLDNFNKRFNDSMKIKLETLNLSLSKRMQENGMSEDYIAEHKLTVHDVVIIASMIEKETASAPESYNISSVIFNRLTNPEKYPMLQIDAALVYYTGRTEITEEDLLTDHPYNTYTRPGLIPGAIANPGSYSLDAALTPTDTEYYYYALDPAIGAHHFSKTLEEHNEFLESIRKDEQEEEPGEESGEEPEEAPQA